MHERQFAVLLAEFGHSLVCYIGGDCLVAALAYIHTEVERHASSFCSSLMLKPGALPSAVSRKASTTLRA
jgi:hypothetical protein